MKKIFFLLLINSFFLFVAAQPTPSANVGIGTTTPTRAKLEVHGAVGSTSGIFGGESTGISLQSNWPGIGFNHYYNFNNGGNKYIANGYAAFQYFDPTNGSMALDLFGNGVANGNTTAPVRAFTIANNGNIGIRTGPTNASLYVRKGTNFEGSAVFGGTTYNSHFHYGTAEDTYIRGGRNGSKVIINDINGGKVVIGGGNAFVSINNGIPVYPLEIRQVNGRGILLVEPNNSFNNWEFRASRAAGYAGANMNLIYNGQAKGYFVFGYGEYFVYSDRRLKTGIESLQTVLNKIMQLQPVEYEMKYHNIKNEKSIGFIAQDVKQLFPELVTITTDTGRGNQGITDLHGLNYNGFTVLSIKAIQEQQQLIKKMQQQNKELSKRIAMAEAIAISEK